LTYEKAAAEGSFESEEIFNIYLSILFNVNQLINANEVYKNLSSYKARALIYQSILLADDIEKKLYFTFLLKDLFKKAFDIDYIDSIHVVKAIAQFERTLISSNSKYDKYLRQEVQLTPSELNGYVIFNTEKGDCFHCHGTDMFMDNLFHNNGLDAEPFTDLGLAKVTGLSSDNGKFKVPTLRNIEFSAPYMHDSRFSSLEEVVEHYSGGLNYSSTVDPLMKKLNIGGLQLTNQEKQDLIAFLKTLSDTDFITNPDFTP